MRIILGMQLPTYESSTGIDPCTVTRLLALEYYFYIGGCWHKGGILKSCLLFIQATVDNFHRDSVHFWHWPIMATHQKGTIIVTGANGYLGSAIVRHIVSSPELQSYHSIFIVRDKSAANTRLTSALKAAVEKVSCEVVSLDLASLANVRRVATAINGRISTRTIPPIRALVLNAAFIEFETQTWTQEDGFDMAFAANYLGHWLLTVMLLQSIDLKTGRITVVGSDIHNPDDWLTETIGPYTHPDNKWRPFITGDNIDPIALGTWSTRADDPSTQNGLRRYGAAKFCLVTMMFVIPLLARRPISFILC